MLCKLIFGKFKNVSSRESFWSWLKKSVWNSVKSYKSHKICDCLFDKGKWRLHEIIQGHFLSNKNVLIVIRHILSVNLIKYIIFFCKKNCITNLVNCIASMLHHEQSVITKHVSVNFLKSSFCKVNILEPF